MLLIDKEVVSAEEFAKRFGLPFPKIAKAPEFEINQARKSMKKFGQSEEISSPVGTRFHSHILVKDLVSKKTIEIRYAEYTNEEPFNANSDKIVTKYYPAKVAYLGESMLVDNMDIDLALYLFVHPLNQFSPFRDQLKENFHYSFNDKQLKGEKIVSETMLEAKAMSKIVQTTGDELKVLAKGLGIQSVDQKDEVSIQAEMIAIAKKDIPDFLIKMNSQKTIVKGLIFAAVDNGLLKLDESNGRTRWIWGGGDKQGIEIIDFINNGQPATDTLTSHIFSKINEFLPALTTSHKKMNAEKVADEYLDSIERIDLKDIFAKPKASGFGGSTDDTSTKETFVEPDTTNQELVDKAKKLAEIVPPTVEEAKAPLATTNAPPAAEDFTPPPFTEDDLPEEHAFLKGPLLPNTQAETEVKLTPAERMKKLNEEKKKKALEGK